MAERWEFINGYPGYLISSHGRVFSRKLKRCIDPPLDHYGYQRVGLWNKLQKRQHFVHRLVALHFIPNPENKPTVNHKDKNILNNNMTNLEWATVAEQNAHRNLTYKGTKNIHAKPVILIKDGIEYPFTSTRDAMSACGASGKYWKKLKAGEVETIKGFKIKNSATQ